MKIYIAKYEDNLYPEDNWTLGVYTSQEKADESIDITLKSEQLKNPNHTGMHKKSSLYYSTETVEFDLPPELESAIEEIYLVAKNLTKEHDPLGMQFLEKQKEVLDKYL